jgi:hypothetical protein
MTIGEKLRVSEPSSDSRIAGGTAEGKCRRTEGELQENYRRTAGEL